MSKMNPKQTRLLIENFENFLSKPLPKHNAEKLKEVIKNSKKEKNKSINEFTKNVSNGLVNGEIDDEGRMVKSELLYIAKNAQKCADMIKSDDQQVEAWVQSHITSAKELISHVADYMRYKDEEV